MTVRLGRIGYLNVLPIYHPLETGLVEGDFTVTSGPPAELNRLMHQGALDVSAASSVEYARNADQYYLVPDLAIGSRGPVRSVLLLSRFPLMELGGKTVLVSSQTHTSAALLRILITEHWRLDVSFVTGDTTTLLYAGERPDAILAIGDEALNLRHHQDYPHQVDLGQAWQDLTGLPFIFGVWIAQKERVDADPVLFARIAATLVAAKQWGNEHLGDMCVLASDQSYLGQREMCEYFAGLVYDLGEREQHGLTAFFERLRANGTIETVPELRFINLEPLSPTTGTTP